MDIAKAFRSALQSAGVAPGDNLVAGVSGGADSLALLDLLASLPDESRLSVHVLHVHHGIRGHAADGDARFVEETCRAWGVPCRVEKFDVPALARANKQSLEEAAREARYRALYAEARRVGARWIVVAHNADDQAETVLMHFVRGSGMAGLRGMPPVQPAPPIPLPADGAPYAALIRPLLAVSRAEIEARLAARDLAPRLDATNLEMTAFRNRLRHEAMPLLAKLNPRLRQTLGRTAAIMAADWEWHEAELRSAFSQVARQAAPDQVTLDRAAWQAAPLAVQRGLIRMAALSIRPGLRDVSFTQVDHAARVGREGATGARATLPGGLSLRVAYDALVIAREGAPVEAPDWPLLEQGAAISLSAPGSAALPGGWRLALSIYEGPRSGPEWDNLIENRWAALLDVSVSVVGATHPCGAGSESPLHESPLALRLRTRQRGDRFTPQGAGGTQKLSEFMINAKIPAAWRDRLPVLTVSDEIAWLCGWRVDQRFVVTPETKEVWLAKFDKG